MNFQSVVEDVKGRVETLGAQGQQAAKISLETVRQVNTIVVDSIQGLIKDNSSTARDFFTSAKSGFEKAKADGFKAVASDPIAYLPSTEKFAAALNETISHLSKTGDELFKTLKSGVEDLQSHLSGSPVVAKAKTTAKSATKTVKKTVAGVKKEVKKVSV